jgi:hypothetical protein
MQKCRCLIGRYPNNRRLGIDSRDRLRLDGCQFRAGWGAGRSWSQSQLSGNAAGLIKLAQVKVVYLHDSIAYNYCHLSAIQVQVLAAIAVGNLNSTGGECSHDRCVGFRNVTHK